MIAVDYVRVTDRDYPSGLRYAVVTLTDGEEIDSFSADHAPRASVQAWANGWNALAFRLRTDSFPVPSDEDDPDETRAEELAICPDCGATVTVTGACSIPCGR